MSLKNLQLLEQVNTQDDASTTHLKSHYQKLSNWITKNWVMSQLDAFSMEVRFLVRGEEEFKTLFAGFLGIFVYVIVGLIVYFIAWPATVDSRISYVKYSTKTQSTGVTLFEFTDQPISFTIIPRGNNIIPSQFRILFYYLKSGQAPYLLQLDTNCKYGNFCLTPNVNKGISLQIYGGQNAPTNASIMVEILWCNLLTRKDDCPDDSNFIFTFSVMNTVKNKQKEIIPFNQTYQVLILWTAIHLNFFSFQVTKQQYISNNRILGHLANAFSSTYQMYNINYKPKLYLYLYTLYQVITQNIPPQAQFYFNANFVYSGESTFYTEEFVDLSVPLIFMFALIDPIRFIINQLLLKRYNQNCRDLYIADKLFYIEDSENHRKYNFSSGSAVILVCLFHRQRVMYGVEFLLGKFGKNIVDVLPPKYVYIMRMIDKGAAILADSVFFGGLEELGMLEDAGKKKGGFGDDDDDEDGKQGDKQVGQLEYFPSNELFRAAFTHFCEDNEYHTAARKNKAYNILLDNKYSTNLKDDFRRQFQKYVINMQKLKLKGMVGDNRDEVYLPVEFAGKDKGDETYCDFKVSKMESSGK